MKGRKPKPAEIRRKDGNPSKRSIGDPVLVGKRLGDEPEVDEVTSTELVETQPEPPAPPDWMRLPETLALSDELDDDDSARRLWDQVCRLLADAQILTEGDLYAVEQFVMATLEARRAYFELRTEGSTIPTVNPAGGRASKTTNPAYRVWRDANSAMLKWAEHLGLTPVARARLGLAIGHGRKLAQELGDLPEQPLERSSEVDGSAEEIDPYEKGKK